MAHVAGLRIYPVKALDGTAVERARITPGGTLEGDREYALFDPAGEPINGKRTASVHELEASFDFDSRVLTLDPGGETVAFDLDAERERAEEWFGEYFGEDVRIERDAELGFVDRREAGPSVVSTATLEEVASWFDGLSVESVRRRLRANVEIGGVPAFWEDRLVSEGSPGFEAGGVRFEGVTPCGRCVVPARDPDTGEPLDGFRERFVERREATFPEWADEEAFDHYYALMSITRIPEGDRGGIVEVGDPVERVPAGSRNDHES